VVSVSVNYVCSAVGDDDLRCERVCVVEFFAVERGGSGAGGGGFVGGGGGVAGWAGAARSLAAAAAGFFWAGILGVELCRRYGGVAGGAVSAAGWANIACCRGAVNIPSRQVRDF
jgi:hypothetical protein